MFKHKTVFILGAGASLPYGYPLGNELITQIINNIKDDEILLPQNDSKEWYKPNENNQYVFDIFKENFDLVDSKTNISLRETQRIMFNEHPRIIYRDQKSKQYLAIKISEFDKFYNLQQDLTNFAPVSIDTFLRDHPSHAEAGKTMIIYSLLKNENKNKFKRNEAANKDNWYSHLINDILSGYTDRTDILQNKLNIITFNYSLDLDYCLFNRFKNIEAYQNEIGQQFITGLNDKIHHVYGQLYKDEITNAYGNYYSESGATSTLNMQRFSKAVASAGNIKLIQDRVTDDDKVKYKEIISEAKEIIIIGFGFDRDNLTTLGFPDNENAYRAFLSGKTFKYMDYDGQMNNLHKQLLQVQKRFLNHSDIDYALTRSVAKSITHAYQNDFKISIY